jgi:predicted metal-dependent enzyme (double-stranded beta helix superfamily)
MAGLDPAISEIRGSKPADDGEGRSAMFDLDRFIEDCRAAVREDATHKAAREVLARANSDPTAILAALGEPERAGVTPLYKSAELTILNVIWGKRMTIMPHDHTMWAVIGVYTGREDNIFWRRVPGQVGGLIEAAGAKSLGERCAEPLGRDIIHSVTNPLGRLTAAIHVYGGDFYDAKRSDWDPENLLEREYDFALHRRMFEEANA